MKVKEIRMAIVLAAVLVFSASFASAFEGGEGHGKFRHDPLFRLMHKMQFTDQQKQQVAAILKKTEPEARNIAMELANARVQLSKTILSGGDVSAPSQQVAVYQEQAAQLRSQIMGQIIKILTPEQQATLQKKLSKMGTHVNDRINKRFDRLDAWLAKHGQ